MVLYSSSPLIGCNGREQARGDPQETEAIGDIGRRSARMLNLAVRGGDHIDQRFTDNDGVKRLLGVWAGCFEVIHVCLSDSVDGGAARSSR